VIHFTKWKRSDPTPNAQSSSDTMSSPDGTQDSCIAMDSIAGVEPGNQDGQAKGRMSTSVAPCMESGGHHLTFLDESLCGTAGYDSPKEEEAETSEDEVNKTAANKVEDAKTPEGISEYEKLRHHNIRKNNARLRAIGLDMSFPLKPKKAIKKKTPPSSSVPTRRNPSQVAKGTNSKSSRLANNRARRGFKKDSSWNDKEVQEEEEEEAMKAARKPCPRNDDTLSEDNEEEEEEDDREEKGEINKGVARKNPLIADDSDDDTDETYKDNKGTEEDEENVGREEDDDDDDDPKLREAEVQRSQNENAFGQRMHAEK
jgi:hypothetical protein